MNNISSAFPWQISAKVGDTIENYPNEVSNDELMLATGYLKTSVTTFRQKLCARNLIERPQSQRQSL